MITLTTHSWQVWTKVLKPSLVYLTESFPTQYSEISINQLCKVVEDRVSMHDAHILKFWMIIIVIDLKTVACFQCRLHTFAICNVQLNSGPSAIKKWGNYKEIETWLDEQNNPHLLLMNFMSFKSHQNRKRFGQFKAKIRSLTSRNIIQLQWHQSGKFFRLRAVI